MKKNIQKKFIRVKKIKLIFAMRKSSSKKVNRKKFYLNEEEKKVSINSFKKLKKIE